MKWFSIAIAAVLIVVWHLGSGGSGGFAAWSLWPNTALDSYILQQIRLPRLVLAAANGMALGVAGAVLQLMLRNPLAEPGITGISGGAAVATVAALYLGQANPVGLALPLIGLAGGLAALLCLWLLAGRYPQGIRIILVGVALAALFGAIIAVILNLAPNPFAFQEWALWLMGSVANRGWPYVWLVMPALIVSAGLLWWQRRFVQVQIFDEQTVETMGFHTTRSKFILLLAVALLTSVSVVSAGVIGFIGLVAPHLVRLLGVRQPLSVVMASGLGGALLLVAVDALVKSIDTRVELQLGVVIALLGAPWLLVLLLKKQVNHA